MWGGGGKWKMTNYEVIKKMSIEEMAVSLMCPNDMGADVKCGDHGGTECVKCTLEWLQQEA